MIFVQHSHLSKSLAIFSSFASFLTNLYPKACFLSALNLLVSVLGFNKIRATEDSICLHYKGVCFNLFHLTHCFICSLQLAYWLSICFKFASNSFLTCFKVASNLFQICFKFGQKSPSYFISSDFQIFCEEDILKIRL